MVGPLACQLGAEMGGRGLPPHQALGTPVRKASSLVSDIFVLIVVFSIFELGFYLVPFYPVKWDTGLVP